MITNADVHSAAEELVERYGGSAMAVAQERVAALSAAQDQSGMNVALRILSALEALPAGEPK